MFRSCLFYINAAWQSDIDINPLKDSPILPFRYSPYQPRLLNGGQLLVMLRELFKGTLRGTAICAWLLYCGLGNVANAANYTVANTNDSGPGSLRQAVIDANATPSVVDTITFAIPGSGPHTITLTSALPDLTDPCLTIDGTTQSGSVCGELWSGTQHTLQSIFAAMADSTVFGFPQALRQSREYRSQALITASNCVRAVEVPFFTATILVSCQTEQAAAIIMPASAFLVKGRELAGHRPATAMSYPATGATEC